MHFQALSLPIRITKIYRHWWLNQLFWENTSLASSYRMFMIWHDKRTLVHVSTKNTNYFHIYFYLSLSSIGPNGKTLASMLAFSDQWLHHTIVVCWPIFRIKYSFPWHLWWLQPSNFSSNKYVHVNVRVRQYVE